MTNTCPADARIDALATWLRAHQAHYGLNLSTLAPASADASFRRYFRLESSGTHGPTLIAVDAPPPEKCREFAQIAGLLASADVHVPRVLECDFAQGFMLVTDLGTTPTSKYSIPPTRKPRGRSCATRSTP